MQVEDSDGVGGVGAGVGEIRVEGVALEWVEPETMKKKQKNDSSLQFDIMAAVYYTPACMVYERGRGCIAGWG